MEMKIDVNSFTVGDLEDLEEHTGEPFEETFRKFEKGSIDLKALKVIVWIAGRKEDPEFKLEQARDVEIAKVDVQGLQQARPTRAAGGGARRPSSGGKRRSAGSTGTPSPR